MSNHKLEGIYVITDDYLTPENTIMQQIEQSLRGGASIVQLRDKQSSDEQIARKIQKIQALCHEYGALFVLNDYIDLAVSLGCDGLHIGKSDHHNFESIRRKFQGILGVSCYGNITMAKDFERQGADYVAFGSFFESPTKPTAGIVPLELLSRAKAELEIPVCAIGGINTQNIQQIAKHSPDMISLVHDIWSASDVTQQTLRLSQQFKGV